LTSAGRISICLKNSKTYLQTSRLIHLTKRMPGLSVHCITLPIRKIQIWSTSLPASVSVQELLFPVISTEEKWGSAENSGTTLSSKTGYNATAEEKDAGKPMHPSRHFMTLLSEKV